MISSHIPCELKLVVYRIFQIFTSLLNKEYSKCKARKLKYNRLKTVRYILYFRYYTKPYVFVYIRNKIGIYKLFVLNMFSQTLFLKLPFLLPFSQYQM